MSMKAIYIQGKYLKNPEEMKVETIPIPEPNKDQVLINVKAVGANFFDYLQIQGKFQVKPEVPFTPGSELSGVVVKVGDSVTKFKVGDKVFGSIPWGAYAEYAVSEVSNLIKMPDTLTFEQAAGIHITYPTGYTALVLRAKLQPGETVLVLAAAGGVGMAAVQIAKALGATVIAAVGSESKFEVCKEMGADHTINYSEKGWVNKVMKLTNGKGVDVIYDPVGNLREAFKCIAYHGRALVVGFAGGVYEKFMTVHILNKSASILGVVYNSYLRGENGSTDTESEVWKGILDIIAKGSVKPIVFKTKYIGLERTADALNAIVNRQTYGKAVVIPTSSQPKM
ncbi:hypothetical protein BB559_002094 [Furculomyces boomerangus]|uniref:Enoyl reductase (ER) domain-containing protein n=2 Tax=Harpellales TaxID=61421 RepID=A0A2T9YYA2_9FUNG|nr:hypothetical protein BB559_002094 [Furculomyces boomerangus]PWA02327.1 hypothetical protein BB558_001537 [Smittium angustum]